jgi:hypothetical protein
MTHLDDSGRDLCRSRLKKDSSHYNVTGQGPALARVNGYRLVRRVADAFINQLACRCRYV